ncbi:MAG: radical SAM protein [Candidatus Omnitrophota bacterium]|nr:radical SAM protein [Candidatus Omnitrophota bacterium]
MTISDNMVFAQEIEIGLDEILPVKFGVNKKNELVRLVYEICRAGDLSINEVFTWIEIDRLIEGGKGELFHRVKDALVRIRYPSAGPDDDLHIMPVRMDAVAGECSTWDLTLKPEEIFIEKDVLDLEWTQAFLRGFPQVKTALINDVKDVFKTFPGKDPLELYNLRREKVFLTKNRSAFIKICPCTKGYKRCGYWILNLGFGCPMDCVYCYLQTYSNAPGMILPANIKDYYGYIRGFDRKAGKRTRIGTGEFTDSLAFDKYTGYSSYLIPFFRDMKNLVLELKTKTGNIDNVLKEQPHENAVISWSVNTPVVAEKYEKGGINVSDRIEAAVRAAERGFKIGFHFDPIVYYNGWKDEYKNVIEEMFTHREIREKTVWISLGTLRYTPSLKQVAEQRFEENLMFYQGEFFMDTDGKLRYPRDLRVDMYNRMIGWIRSFVDTCWIYLCMEPEELWKKTVLKRSDYSFR